MCNLDLTRLSKADGATTAQKGELEAALLDGYEWPDEVQVRIVGAGELAAFLNDCPHVRSAYFAPLEFSTWEKAWQDHCRQSVVQREIKTIGREAQIAAIRALVDAPDVRAIVLCGPAQIGKTRLMLEATRHRSLDTVIALNPMMSVLQLDALVAHDEVIVVVEDPEAELAASLVRQSLAMPKLKLLMALSTQEHAPRPSFGTDRRAHVLAVSGLAEDAARDLLCQAGARLDWSLESWVLEQAGGNPGILIAAASYRGDLRAGSGTFLSNVAEELETRLRRKLGDSAVTVLRLYSLLSFVGAKGDRAEETRAIHKHFGQTLALGDVSAWCKRLARAGYVVERGSYVEARPPVLANYLAVQLVRGRFDGLFALLKELDQPARKRLGDRLRMLESEDVARLAKEFLAAVQTPDGLWLALANLALLEIAASVVPAATAAFLESSLGSMSLSERQEITGDHRCELVHVLEHLLLRQSSSESALKCLALLAEAENESWANNATGIFCEALIPRHPQMPLPLSGRLAVLRWMVDSAERPALRCIAIKAIEEAVAPGNMMQLRSVPGPVPADSAPLLTWGQIWEYLDALVGLLMGIAEDKDPEVATAARDVLPRVLSYYVTRVPPERVLPRLTLALEWVLSPEMGISPSAFADTLRAALDLYQRRRESPEEGENGSLDDAVEAVEALRQRLDSAPFDVRLRKWAGEGTIDSNDYRLDSAGRRLYRGDQELQALAQQAIACPELVGPDLRDWLLSEQARGAHGFFFHLGQRDPEREWLASIEEFGGSRRGHAAFSSYSAGLAISSPDFVRQRLDVLTSEGKVKGLAIVDAMRSLDEDPRGVCRVEALISSGDLDPSEAGPIIGLGRWIDSLPLEEYTRLLRAIAGPTLANAPTVVDMLSTWSYHGHSLEGPLAEFAWQCLESSSPIVAGQRWDHEQLAARLAPLNPVRGVQLMERLLEQAPHNRDCWNPLDSPRTNAFWEALVQCDPKKAYHTVLSAASRNALALFRVTWALPSLIDLERDGNVLQELATDREDLAVLLCQCMSVEQNGFWDFAFSILGQYPGNSAIHDALSRAVLYPTGAFWGPLSAQIEQRLDQVEALLEGSSVPAGVPHTWLCELSGLLQGQVEKEKVREEDERVEL
jgi:hypothetical protein